MKHILAVFILFFSIQVSSQIVGKVVDSKGNPLPFVNIYLESSYVGTTSNDDGNYILDVEKKSKYKVIFQFLGFKTVSKTIEISSFPYILNINMVEESTSLAEVVISNKEDPAYRIIRETMARRKDNSERIGEYKADFYSRGVWRMDSIPEKFLGKEIGDLDGTLDSTRTGIIYLSETISEIAYQKPDDFKENIIASKVSGNDNGFSFNSARDANFSFYENSISLNAAIVSPIANNALNYYKYKLDGVFYEGSKLINKIIVIPRRPNDRVWQGVIYIVEDDWQLYGVDLSTSGQAIQIPFISELVFKQSFKYDQNINFWVKISQTVDFRFGMFGFNGLGRFIAIYSNYNFDPQFTQRSFTNEILSFEEFANKKDTLFWNGNRPVPLTDEELNDYIKKDSIQTLRKSKKYMDSLDQKNNKLKWLDPVSGYTFSNSYKKWNLDYDGPFPGISFNTVQGWNGNAGLTYSKSYDENRTSTVSVYTRASYGISEDRLRFVGGITRRFNRVNKLLVSVSGGSKVAQFNENDPISSFMNTITSLFFERNYMKVYELNYGELKYSQEVFNGLFLRTSIGYESRNPLFNTTDYVTIPNEKIEYTSNNPLIADGTPESAIQKHEIIKTEITTSISFGQKYMSYPNGKYNISSDKYPELTITFENGTGASNKDYNYSQIRASLQQTVDLGNKGSLYYHFKGGTFFNAENISFVDYQHFNGNQTRIGNSSIYGNVFNLLPYYGRSTNQGYFEGHAEHDFKGWILGKIPGINQLNLNLVIGGHILATENLHPYSELSIGVDNLGFGKFRMLRLDYVNSFTNGVHDSAFIFGLKFLDIFN